MGKIARRAFLLGSAAIAGGLAVGYWYVRRPHPNPLLAQLERGEQAFNPYVKIAADGTVTLIAPRAEMGQGVQTTLAALVAEELDVDLAEVRIEHGPAGDTYYNAAMLEEGGPFPVFDESFAARATASVSGTLGKVLGLQVTGGSSSIRDGYVKMREAGAAARALLVAAAAARWDVAADGLETKSGRVVDPASGDSLGYGELAAEAAALDPPAVPALRDPKDWRLLGKPVARTDVPAKVDGSAGFGIDVRLPDMLHATVVIAPRFGAKPVAADRAAAEAVPGVRKVVAIDILSGAGFGIIADNTWAAFRGAEALAPEWGPAPYPGDSESQMAAIAAALDGEDGFTLRENGDAVAALAEAGDDEVLAAEYRAPWLAHACMEPMNATAQLKDGRLTIWAPNQAPTIIRTVAASLAGLESDQVAVNTTYLGGGFGRRGEVDVPLYAVELAKHAEGRPVKVTWSREEDTRHDTYRPAAVARLRARLRKGGAPDVLEGRFAAPSIIASVMARTFPDLAPAGPDRTIVEGAFDQPYGFAHHRIAGTPVDLAIPVGFWRSVGNSQNAFFHESFLDEVAHASQVDPVAMRLELMREHPTARKVVEKVAEMSNWGARLPAGRGKGIAFTLSFGAWVAEVVEVADSPDGLRVEQVWCAADLGLVLDPAIVEAQMMSGIVFGLSAAIGQKISFSDGMVEQGNFDGYDAVRMDRCPRIAVSLLENARKMGGAGEPGLPPLAPALANAIFAATGTRLREMPFDRTVDFA